MTIAELQRGDVVNFDVNNTILGLFKEVTVTAVGINYDIACKVDPALPNNINYVHAQLNTTATDPNLKTYIVVKGLNQEVALDTDWVLANTLSLSGVLAITTFKLFSISTTERATVKSVLDNLGIRYEIE